MEINLKTPQEIKVMGRGGKIASCILKELSKILKPGLSTLEIDKTAASLVQKAGAEPSFKGFRGYPGAICISVNEEVVHGLPGKRILESGDIVGLDIGVLYQGFHTDTAVTCGVGKISKEAEGLLENTQRALFEGIKFCQIGNFLGDVQFAIQKTLEKSGLGVVRDLVGHGVGRELQEAPTIPNFGKAGTGPKLKEGMTLAIEPMSTLGDYHVHVLDDGWTIVTVDRSLSAHFEHTVAVTKVGPEILTS